MSWPNFLLITALCAATILISRTLPLMVLKGRELPAWLSRALGYIPPAAFAALVVNDLVQPITWPQASLASIAATVWPACIGWLAALVVMLVALKLRSLTWCIVVGVATYGLLLLVPL